VTRQELTQVIVTIVNHYEKQIGELQDTCNILANQMAALMTHITSKDHKFFDSGMTLQAN
jgi:hypothetical protein